MSDIDRSTYVGGGDAGAIFGKNDFQNIIKTWRKKIGMETDDIDNQHIIRGNTMEPIIEDWVKAHLDPTMNERFAFEKYGTKDELAAFDAARVSGLRTPQIFIKHKKFPFIGGHPDGIGSKILWEFKAPAMSNVNQIDRFGISKSWVAQVQYYMWITGLPEGRIAVWHYDKHRPIVIRLKPDKKLHKLFGIVVPEFWEAVVNKVEPDIKGYTDHIDWVFDEELDELAADYENVRKWHFDTKDRQKELKSLIIANLNGRTDVISDKWHIKANKQRRGNTEFYRLIARPVELAEDKE